MLLNLVKENKSMLTDQSIRAWLMQETLFFLGGRIDTSGVRRCKPRPAQARSQAPFTRKQSLNDLASLGTGGSTLANARRSSFNAPEGQEETGRENQHVLVARCSLPFRPIATAGQIAP